MQPDGQQRNPGQGRHRRDGLHRLRRALGQERRRPPRRRGDGGLDHGSGIALADIDAFWLGTLASGLSGLTLSRPLKLDYKPVTRVENFCATGSRGVPQRLLRRRFRRLRHGHGHRRREAEGLRLLRPRRRASPAATAPTAAMTAPAMFSPARPGLRQEVRRRRRRTEGRHGPHRLEEPLQRRPQPAGPVPQGGLQGDHLRLAAGGRPASASSTAPACRTGRRRRSSSGPRTPTATPTSPST